VANLVLVEGAFVGFEMHFRTSKMTKNKGRTYLVIHLSCCTFLVDLDLSNSALCGGWLISAPWLGPVWAFTMGLILVGAEEWERWWWEGWSGSAARHKVMHFGHTHALSLLSHNSANFKPKIKILRLLKSFQTGVFSIYYEDKITSQNQLGPVKIS